MIEKGLFLPIPRGKYRRTEHSVDHPVFDLRVYQLLSPFGILSASTVLSSLWPVGQRLMMLCNPTDVSLSKEASKRSLETYFLPSLEAVAESLNWSMTLCSDARMEEVQSRIKDVLWEVDRVGYKCSVNLQWDGTEDSQSTGTLSVRCATCHKAQLAPWAVSFRPFMSLSEYWVAGQGQQRQTLGMPPVEELWNNSSPSTAFPELDACAKWATAGLRSNC